MKKHVKLPNSTSNNEAEYDILLHGLQVCVSQKVRRLMVKRDALLIVKQILGIWACKNERLREKVQAIRRLFNQFEEVQLYHIPRKQNEVADLLAQKAVSCDESKVQVILAATAIKQPRYQGMESLAPIVSYILEGEFPQSFTKARKQRLMEKASAYLFLEGALYQRGKDQVCRRIPTVEEIPSILEGLHEEACGGHFAQELTAKKILLSGYVWPSLHIDVQHWCKSCHNCQVNGNKHLLHGPRQLVLANGPFEKWGIDAMGPLPRTKNGKLYILVAIDYMTRWVEAQSVTRVNEKTVSRWSIVGYKEATEFTPFHLVYGQEALQPIELNIPTMWLHGKAAQRKEEEWTNCLLTLAELEWKREGAYECYKRKATQVKDKLDKEVKNKGIKEGDLVLSDRALHCQRVEEGLQRLYQYGGQLNPDKCHVAEKEVVLLGHVISQEGIKVDPSRVQAILDLPPPNSAQQLITFVQKVRYMSRFIHLLSQIIFPLQQLANQEVFSWEQEHLECFNEVKEVLGSLPTIMPPDLQGTYYLCPSVGLDAFGAILMQKDPKTAYMWPIYFTTKVMNQGQKGYTDIEQLVFSLIVAIRKFRSYLLPKPFIILTLEHNLPYAIQHMSISSKISKWVLELQEYEYTFIVEDSTRASLADVLTYKVKEKKITPKAQGKLDFSPQGEIEDAYTLFFDGAYRRQRNKAAGGFVILNEEKKEVLKKGIQLHLAHSNNEAEYATLKAGLEECKSMGIKRLMVKGDALLIVRHVQGTWACKNSKLLQWLHEVKLLMKNFKAIQIQHISRQHNKEADNMANSQFEVMVGAIKFKEPFFQGQETMEDILYFLEIGECPKHLERVQRHRLVRKALSYQLIGEYLYHKGKDLVLRRVPLVKEIEKNLMSCHDGVCGGHFAQEITSKKILQAGFVWLSLHRDVQHWCKACKACQQAGDCKLSYGPRFPIFAYGPFEKWGIDAIGPLPHTSTDKQYILTATDYMTRADLLDALLENLSIKHVHSTPYYPQCNGLVEKTNGVLCKIITKHVRDRPQDWDKHLTAALWAYRTSFKVSTQFTPYHLVYGQEALLPIEVELGSLRVLAKETTSSKEKLEQKILDLQRLELDREAATDYYITHANKKREQFNNKVKEKKLEEGMLVMRYDSRLDLSHSKKFLQRWEGPYVIFKKFKNGSYRLQDLSGKIHKYPINGWRLKEFFQRIQPIKEEIQVSLNA
ncbi:hypothetical protein L7F22_027064 [Adiantum nelumboides]|nr:hypothetical protein [Adiantum nelumboides]